MCNGRPDCADASDETGAACATAYCPPYGFRCAYGACISGHLECNGNRDCADNSDEVTVKCPANAINNTLATSSYDQPSTCAQSASQFRCRTSGACIRADAVCDGTVDCTDDASDETLQLCAGVNCPRFAFRCAYGGCVHALAKCNGTAECRDHSDELPTLCGYAVEPPSTTTTTTERTPVRQSDSEQCRLRLPWYLTAVYSSEPNVLLSDGSLVQNLAEITYSCVPGFFLRPSNDTTDPRVITTDICIAPNDMTAPMQPECERRCDASELHTSIGTKADCRLGDQSVSCAGNEQLRLGTRALISCRFGYRRPNTGTAAAASANNADHTVCTSNGAWSQTPMRCERICGTDGSAAGSAYIVGGEVVKNNTLVPWHTGIYSDVRERGVFVQICGGTILTERLIVSAAHCFWNLAEDRLHDVQHFRIATGKYWRVWDATAEALPVQRLAVQEIRLRTGYADYLDNYNADLAVLVVREAIVFHSHVVPICMELNVAYNDVYVRSDEPAMVAGWGLTTSGGQPSDVLKVLELPTVSVERCVRQVPATFRKYVTLDKFCAGFVDEGRSLCQGDSGGGLVTWRTDADGQRTYFLRGIVSTGVNRQMSCNANMYTVFTNVHFYQDLLQHVISEVLD